MFFYAAFWWMVFLAVGCLPLKSVVCVAIWKLSVPRWVQNGTDDPVLLDCEYVYNENDVRLVVKWFFNDMLEPVYQWIPELNSRHTSGILTGRLDDSFRVNTQDSQYRALKIIRPTTELSGRYTCVVSSLAGHDSKEQSMMVYVPAKNFTLSYNTKTTESGGESRVEVQCVARGLHPRPTLRLFSITPDMARTELERGRPRTRKVNGTYDIELSRIFRTVQLPAALTFECVLEIPGTDYEVRRRTVFNPGECRVSKYVGNIVPLHFRFEALVARTLQHGGTFRKLSTGRAVQSFILHGLCRSGPSIKYDQIVEYFIEKLGHDDKKMLACKSLEAYHYVKNCEVHSITGSVLNDKVVLKGIVSRSQRSGTLYTSRYGSRLYT